MASATAALLLAGPLLAGAAPEAELKPKTVEAFNRYIRQTEERIDRELARPQVFLWPDTLPADQARKIYEQLRAGEFYIEQLETRDAAGREIEIPDGMVHHWVGVAFLPGVGLDAVLALAQDFDHAAQYFGPDVQASRLLEHEGDRFRVWMRLQRKKMVTVVLHTTQEAQFRRLSPARALSRGVTVRIAEVADPGTPQEKEKPVGRDRGFLWRLNTYWRYEEKDGGTYVQLEAVALSREIPFLLRWFIAPLVKSASREYLTHILEGFRRALVKHSGARARSHYPSRQRYANLLGSWPSASASC